KKKKKKPAAAVVAPDPSQRSGPRPEDSLELDFEAVGIAPKQRKLRELGGRISGEHKAVDAAPPRRSRAGNFAGSGGAATAPLDDERGFFLGRDGYTAVPLGVAIGLVISLMVAIQLQRSADAAALQPLEEELRIATASASLIDSGEVRSVSRLDSALESEYDELKKSFVFKWLAIGLPLGFVLGRIPRST
ncbi:MAG: hypothetical protein JKY37_25455, partial [Nannocystaceae bacterium]|nr:hypothetical protein [Nannocystaceae bacterium]